jgi:DNA-directed RNA polymerase subunit RPC12/RpoP
MTYDVHIFAEVRVKIPSIEADSQTEAIRKAEELADLYQLFDKESPAAHASHTAWNEEIHGFLVDQADDPEHEQSNFYKPDGVTIENDFYKTTVEGETGPTVVLTPVSPGKCKLEGPYECPTCHGHVMLDATFLDQVAEEIRCPYCGEKVRVPPTS